MTEAQLREQARKVSEQLAAIEDKKWRKEMTPFVGRCFRYRNCYSTDRSWWLYAKAVRLDPESRGFIVFQFETAVDGEISINFTKRSYGWNPFSGYKEITEAEFEHAWKELSIAISDRTIAWMKNP